MSGEILCILFGVKPLKVKDGIDLYFDYWSPFKKILVSDFHNRLRKYNLDTVDLKIYNQVKKRFDGPDFQASKLKAASMTLVPIRDWVEKVLKAF